MSNILWEHGKVYYKFDPEFLKYLFMKIHLNKNYSFLIRFRIISY